MSQVQTIKTLTELVSASIDREALTQSKLDDTVQINDQLQDQIEILLGKIRILQNFSSIAGVSRTAVLKMRNTLLDLEIAEAFEVPLCDVNEISRADCHAQWMIAPQEIPGSRLQSESKSS